jgi:hypothetical protein
MRSIVFFVITFFSIVNAFADTEPNSTWQTATMLPQDSSVAGIQDDDDWYAINIVGNQPDKRILIDLTFTHADGNIDMLIYGDDYVISNPVGAIPGLWRGGSAGTTSDHEFIEHNVSSYGLRPLYIKVSGENLGNGYTLTWTELTGNDDGFEQNDSSTSVKAITENIVAFAVQADEDWYSVEVSPGYRRVLASLRFYNTELATTIDLNLELSDTSGTIIASSTNASGINESINEVVSSPGIYHLRVYGDDNGDGYALDWAGVNSAPQAIANTVTTTEDIPYNFTTSDFTFSDSEGDSVVSATLGNLSLGSGTLTHSSGAMLNSGDTLTAAQLDTLVYTPPANLTGSPLATFDFTVNDFDVGTVAARMDIDVTATTTTTQTTTGGSSSGSISLVGLFALMLIGVARKVYR